MSAVRRLVMGRARDRRFDHPQAHRDQGPDRYGKVAHIYQQSSGAMGGGLGTSGSFGGN